MATCRVELLGKNKTKTSNLINFLISEMEQGRLDLFASPFFKGLRSNRSNFESKLTVEEKQRVIDLAKIKVTEDTSIQNKEIILANLKRLEILIESKQNLTPSKVVTLSTSLYGSNISILENRKAFSINFARNTFIPCLSQIINESVKKQIKSKIKILTTVKYEKKNGETVVLPIGQLSVLNESINAYKQELFLKLYDWLYTHHPDRLFTRDIRECPNLSSETELVYLKYETLMHLAWKAIELDILHMSPILNIGMTQDTMSDSIDPIVAFYILQNFDDTIEYFAPNVVCKQEYKGLVNLVEDKYDFRLHAKKVKSFTSGSYQDMNHEDDIPDLLKSFVGQIKGKNGLYLDNGFLQQLIVAIKNNIENGNSQFDFLYDNKLSTTQKILEFNRQLNSPVPPFEIIDKFQYTLSDVKEFFRQLESSSKGFDSLLIKSDSNSVDMRESSYLSRNGDVAGQFLAALDSSIMVFLSIRPDGTIHYESALDKSLSKQGVRSAIETAIKRTLKAGLKYKYLTLFVVGNSSSWETFSDIYDEDLQLLFFEITGLSLKRPKVLELLTESKNILKLGEFVKTLGDLINKYFPNDYPTTDDIDLKVPLLIEELKTNQTYINISDLWIATDSILSQKNTNQSQDTVPIIGTNTVIGNTKKNMLAYLQEMGLARNASKNLLFTEGILRPHDPNAYDANKYHFIQHIVQACDVAFEGTKGRTLIVKPTELSVGEQASVAIGMDYLLSYVFGGLILTQIEAYSDKVRIAKGAWNFGYSNNSIPRKNTEEIRHIAYEQHKQYYDSISLDIQNFAKEVLGLTTVKNITDAANQFENLIPYDQLYTAEAIQLVIDRNPEDADLNPAAALKILLEEWIAKKISDFQIRNPKNRQSFLRDVHYTFKNKKVSIKQNNIAIGDRITYSYKENGKDIKKDFFISNAEDLVTINTYISEHLGGKIIKTTLIISLNSSLMYYIDQANDEKVFNNARERGWQVFLQNVNNPKIAPLLPQSLISKLVATDVNKPKGLLKYDSFTALRTGNTATSNYLDNVLNLFALFNLIPTTQVTATYLYNEYKDKIANVLLNLHNANYFNEAGREIERKLRETFLRKYFEINAITREADVQVSLKPMWIHDKDKSNILLANHDKVFTDDEIKAIEEEIATRLTKGKKRMNAASAAFMPWRGGTKKGLGEKVKIAHIEHARQAVFNYFGNADIMNSHDGGIWSTSVLRYLERNSFPGHNVASSLKLIVLQPHKAGFEQVKCADYEMTNTWVRWTMKNGLENSESTSLECFDGDKLMKKMLGCSMDMTDFLTNWKADNYSISGYRFKLTIQGIDHQLVDIQSTENLNELNFVWEEDNGSGKQIVNKVTINNLYDLWHAFGGAFSKDVINGKTDYSNNSQEILADLICEYDPSLKELMIGKLVDHEASKSSQGITNSKNILFNTDQELACTWIDASNYGIQLDYSHESEESDIPALTQVITAIAFNGQNIKLVGNTYKVLSLITKNSIEKFVSKWNVPGARQAFHEYMADELLRALETNSLSTNARDIIETAYKKIKEGKLSTLPYSDSQIYFLATSNLLARLNSDTIRARFPGMAVVQNPSNGIIGVYEGSNGIVYSRTAITKKANEWFRVNIGDMNIEGLNPDLALQLEQIINLYLAADPEGIFTDKLINNESEIRFNNFVKTGDFISYFNGIDNIKVQIKTEEDLKNIFNIQLTTPITILHNTIVDFSLIHLGQWLEYDDSITHKHVLIKLDSPIKMKELYDNWLVGLILNLKICRIKLRDLATTRIVWSSNTREDGQLNNDPKNFWLLESTLKLLSTKSSNPRYKFYCDWLNANLAGLLGIKQADGSILRYYFLTEQDFIDYRKGIKNTRTIVNNVRYSAGEEVLPKNYKTKLGLYDEASFIEEAGPSYFYDLVERRFCLDPKLEELRQLTLANKDSEFNKNDIFIAGSDFDIVLTAAPIDDDKVNALVDSNGYIVNDYGIKLDKVKTLSKDDKILIKNYNGSRKSTIIIHTRLLSDENLRLKVKKTFKRIANAYYTTREDILSLNKKLDVNNQELLLKALDELSLAMYNSWQATRETISTRIPSQSFQSFLPNKTIEYTEDLVNNGYMNIWEMWFLGSDFDIRQH